ncbi:MAG: AzlD domain-containing protein [Burkholderiaceae bacterium]
MTRAVPDLLWMLPALALAAYACRAGGFWLMRFVPLTPRVEAALRAAPVAVMAGVVAPAAVHGGPPEWAGLAVVGAVMAWRGNDVVAMLAGVAAVALVRGGS